MKVIDTNLLIRLITNDIPEQRQKAQKIIDESKAGEILIPDVVLTELFFILESRVQKYTLPRKEICVALGDILTSPQLFLTKEGRAALLLAFDNPKLDFTDCLLAIYADHKKDQVLTFDKGLLKILG
ncbi:MAG: PIN domain-containing protein [Candidatus Saccharimonadales bacterium]